MERARQSNYRLGQSIPGEIGAYHALHISTDVGQEPELCFPSGDLLVYLRQTGQSSRGPAFRIHTSNLQARGFHALLKQCSTAPALDRSRGCLQNSCPGCDKHEAAAELYIPAPPLSGMDATFDHHITTRNFFAWLYDMPLAGRSLGSSLVALKKRIDTYRGGPSSLTDEELVKYVDSQKYLDFRECVDHALAAMTLAEVLRKEDLWSDAFAHAVGMSHRDIDASIEYTVRITSAPNENVLISDSRSPALPNAYFLSRDWRWTLDLLERVCP